MFSSVKKGYFFPTPWSSMARSVIPSPLARRRHWPREDDFRVLRIGCQADPPDGSLARGASVVPAPVAVPPGRDLQPRVSPSPVGLRSLPHVRVRDTPV